MKITGILAAIALCGTMAAGVSAGVVANNMTESVNEVRANTHTQNPTVYFVPHDNWVKEHNERFKMNFYDSGEWKGDVEMQLYGTSSVPGPYYNRKVYVGTVTNGAWVNQIQICRMSPAYAQYNYSGRITITADNTLPVLMTENSVDYWNDWTEGSNGVWFTSLKQNGVYRTQNQSPSSSTGRVFFYNSGTHWASAHCGVYAWGGNASPIIWSDHDTSADATIYYFNWFTDDNGTYYGYADIPTNVTGYKIVKLTKDNSYYTAVEAYSDTELIPDSFAYVRYGGSNMVITSGGAHDDVAGANLMKKVIEAYDTCSDSVLNGYGAYNALNTNFYSHTSADVKSVSWRSLKGQTQTLQTHFDAMSSRSSGSGNNRIRTVIDTTSETGMTITIIIAVALVSLTAVGGYFFIRKRREN